MSNQVWSVYKKPLPKYDEKLPKVKEAKIMVATGFISYEQAKAWLEWVSDPDKYTVRMGNSLAIDIVYYSRKSKGEDNTL